MILRALDSNGDWQFGKGQNDYISNNAAIVQDINCRLKSFLGDCFFSVADGIDWFNLLGSKNILVLELAIRTTIINTAGVQGIVDSSLNVDPTTREMFVTYTVNTVYSNNGTGSPVSSTVGLLLTQDGNVITTEDGKQLSLG